MLNSEEILARLMSPMRKPVKIDEMALQARSQKGLEADELLRNEVFTALMDEVEGFYMFGWRKSAVEDFEMREKAHVAVSIIDDLRNTLQSRVRDGEVARETLKKSIRPSI